MEQIRIKRGIEVGVNDNGDSILIDAENTLWIRGYKELIKTIQNIVDSINAIDESAMSEDEQLDVVIEHMRQIMDAIDKQFGADTCKKVFGDIVPMPLAVVEFFDAITPIVEKYTQERMDKINSKYSKNRKGSR